MQPCQKAEPAVLQHGQFGSREVACSAGVAMLTLEEDSAVVYHCLNNQRDQHAEYPCDAEGNADFPGKLVFHIEAAPLLEVLLYPVLESDSYIDFAGVQLLELGPDFCDKKGKEVVQTLLQAGLLELTA